MVIHIASNYPHALSTLSVNFHLQKLQYADCSKLQVEIALHVILKILIVGDLNAKVTQKSASSNLQCYSYIGIENFRNEPASYQYDTESTKRQ